jgi:uncharacterized membrane protein
VTFANPLPWWALTLVVCAAAALAWLAYWRVRVTTRRRVCLSAVRFVTLLLIVILLMRPSARSNENDPASAVVPILVDVSRSMAIEDADGLRRIDRARQLLESQILPALSGRFRAELLTFGAGLAPATPQALTASAPRSDLTSALQETAERFRGQTIAGIVLLSDGGDTSPTDRRGRDINTPVFPVGVGTLTVGRDREVLSVTAAEAVLDDSRVDLAVSAVSHGHGVAPIELRLLENGRPSEVRRATPAADGTPVREVFHVAANRDAPTVYTVEIPAAAGELVPENNSRSVLVQPPSRPRRILLVQGAPGFEHSFLQRAWSGDRGLQIDSVVRKGKNEQGGDTFYIQAAAARSASLASGYPATREDLFGYDGIVLANIEGAALGANQLEATRDFVGKRGGGLLVLGAQSFVRNGLIDTPLEEVLPLDLSDRGRGVLQASAGSSRGANRVDLTAAGETHPIMQLTGDLGETRKRWEAVPALASVSPLGGPRPGANVLALTSGPGGASRALVAVQRYGSGRSMVFTGEASWRWRMMLPATDRSYDTFWRQAVRWLALPATDPVSLTAPATASPGELVTWRISARGPAFDPLPGAAVAVRVTAPGGRVETLPAARDTTSGSEGIFLATQRADGAGIYRAVAEVHAGDRTTTTAAVSLLVGGADSEMTDPRLNLRVLERVATASGGRMVQPGEMTALASQLRAAVPAALVAARRDLWHNGWSFGLIVALLALEWTLRRRWGLR